MTTRKIKENEPPQICLHSGHNPPSMQVFEPGLYEHECDACGHKVMFRVNGVSFIVEPARKIMYVDVGNVPPDEIVQYVKNVKASLKEPDFFLTASGHPYRG